MQEQYSNQRLLALRKVTREIVELLRGQMKEYLSTLAPLLRPHNVLGDYVQGTSKGSIKGADNAFKEIESLYEAVAGSRPFNLSKELKPPLEIISSALDMTPLEYTYQAQSDQESKMVTVTSPVKWVLNYSGLAPGRLKDLLDDRDRNINEIQRFVLHYIVMHVVTSKQVGVSQILAALHFPISSTRLPEFGDLPVTCISSSIPTIRPPDNVIIENTEISGIDVFEEIINLEDVARLRDPLKEQLLEIVKSSNENLLRQ